MAFTVIPIMALIFTCVGLSLQSETSDKFDQNSVSADLGLTAPNQKCEVSYGNRDVNFGTVLRPSETAKKPSRVTWPTNPNTLYSVVMVDLDAPSRTNPAAREWRHWVVVNVDGSDFSKGNVLTDYKGPSPPAGTGLHRYVFLIFQQQGRITDDTLGNNNRGSWKVRNFATKHNLNLIAGNFFQAGTRDED